MNDCRATLHLLSMTLPLSGQPVFPVFLENARRRVWRIWALESRFDLRDRLKARGYRLGSGEDGRPKAWFRDVDDADLAAEEQFLADEIYGGHPRHDCRRIDLRNRFSDRE
jgi:DNA polymerase III subunit epsilon